MTKSNKVVVARWESKSGKHWVQIHQYPDGRFSYEAPGAGGWWHWSTTLDEAIQAITGRLDEFQPDDNVTPLHRVL